MKQKLISLALSAVVLVLTITPAHAASDPKFTFFQDCNTIDKQVSIGFQSNPDNPPSGPEIIAAKLTLILAPSAGVNFNDIKNATLVKNEQYSNVIVAENTIAPIGETLEAKMTIGFTGGTGIASTKDIIFVRGIDKKAYTITVKGGELYPKNSTTNIYKNQATTFTADPKTCEAPAPAPAPTPSPTPTSTANPTPTPASTPTSTATPAPVPAQSGPTEISITSDKTMAKTGDKITVTAIVSNRKGGALDWVQTTGQAVSPENLKNEDIEGGKTKSTFTFTMPETKDPVTLKLTVGTVTQSIVIKPEPPPAPTPAPSANGTPDGSKHGAAGSEAVASGQETLAERLRKRRESMQAQAAGNEAENLKPAAETGATTEPATPGAEAENVFKKSAGLNPSGPKETALMVAVISIAFVLMLHRRKQKA